MKNVRSSSVRIDDESMNIINEIIATTGRDKVVEIEKAIKHWQTHLKKVGTLPVQRGRKV